MKQESIFIDDELVPLIHAAWIDADAHLPTWKKSNMCMYCSNCKHRAGQNKYRTYRYCPWCGAKMDIPVARVNVQDDFVKTITFVGKIMRNEDGWC